MQELIKEDYESLSIEDFRLKVTELEKELFDSDNVLVLKNSKEIDISFPLTHSFSDGVYIREMSMKKNTIVIGKIHNRTHTWFLMKGNLLVLTEGGANNYIAPTYVNATAGSRRIIKALEDSVFINVHPNPENTTDIDKLEKELICSSYEQYEQYKQIKEK